MVSTLVTTSGAADANSYNTLAELNTYLGDRSNADDWNDSVDTDLQTQCAIQAARDFNYLEFAFAKYDPDINQLTGLPDQALIFPLSVHALNGGALYIPKEVKDAHAEQTLFRFRLHNENAEAGDQHKIAGFSRGRVSVSYRKEGTTSNTRRQNICDIAYELLKPWLSQGTRLLR